MEYVNILLLCLGLVILIQMVVICYIQADKKQIMRHNLILSLRVITQGSKCVRGVVYLYRINGGLIWSTNTIEGIKSVACYGDGARVSAIIDRIREGDIV